MVFKRLKDSASDTKATPLNGCWEKLWSEAVNDFRGFMKQQDRIRNVLVLAHKLPGEVFPDLQEADIPEVLNICADQLTEGDLQNLTALSGMPEKKGSYIVEERNQPAVSILQKGLQMTQLIVSLRLSFYREMPEI